MPFATNLNSQNPYPEYREQPKFEYDWHIEKLSYLKIYKNHLSVPFVDVSRLLQPKPTDQCKLFESSFFMTLSECEASQ